MNDDPAGTNALRSPDYVCPICGGALAGAHCKMICRNCGYREDCSDLFEMRPRDTDAPPSAETPRP